MSSTVDDELQMTILENRLAKAAEEHARISNNAPPPPPSTGDVQLVRTVQRSSDGVARVFRRLEVKYVSGDFYVGEVLDGKREGRGTYYFLNGDVYVGEFVADVFSGLGSFKKAPFSVNGKECKGRCYEGEFVGGQQTGRGVLCSGFGDVYDGSFLADAYHGAGTLRYANGDVYVGNWAHGQRSSHGRMVYKTGAVYDGMWRIGSYHGEGVLSNSSKSGGSFSGTWRAGLRHGIGKRVYSTGAEYEGEFVDGDRTGRGVYKSPVGDLYVGEFVQNLYNGEGTLIRADGDRYQGEFKRGAFCGRGRLEYEAGGFYEGEFNAQLRLAVIWRPMKKSVQRWFWDAYNHMPVTHFYDPITGKLLLYLGKKVRPGDVIPPENKDPKKVLPSARLKQALQVKQQRKDVEAAELESFQRALELTGGVNRARAVERWNSRHNPQPEDFRPPIIVGSDQDVKYIAAGAAGGGAVAPAADGKRHGQGVRVWSDGSRYEGDWFADEAHGFGVYVGAGVAGVRYEGEWANGRRHGFGVESYGDEFGMRFICPLGNVHKGLARCIYDGGWVRGKYSGAGTLTCCDGRQYNGDWLFGKRTGIGRWIMVPKKLQYAAVRDVDGKLMLQGTVPVGEFGTPLRLDDAYRVRVYEGTLYKNRRSGFGKTTLNNDDVLEGRAFNGRLQGVVRIAFGSGRVSLRSLSTKCLPRVFIRSNFPYPPPHPPPHPHRPLLLCMILENVLVGLVVINYVSLKQNGLKKEEKHVRRKQTVSRHWPCLKNLMFLILDLQIKLKLKRKRMLQKMLLLLV